MTKNILSICCCLLLSACFYFNQAYAAEPGEMLDTVVHSSEQEAALDNSNKEENTLTEEEKSKPKDQLIKDFVSNVDYASCLNYNYVVKNINEDGKNNTYIFHILTINYNNYLKLAKKFDNFFSKIAVYTETKTLLDQEINKKIYYLSKNYHEIEKNFKNLSDVDPEKKAYRLNKNYSQLSDGWYGVVSNTTSINCYQFCNFKQDQNISLNDINNSLKSLIHKFKISFIAESAAKDAFDSELARNTEEFKIGDNEILAPVFTTTEGRPFCILCYRQKLNIPADQTETVKGITGRYELTRVDQN